jgi:hypothetical protein
LNAPVRLPLDQARLVRITGQFRAYTVGLHENLGIRERYSYAVNGRGTEVSNLVGKGPP